jgi:hypothetical protein
VKYFICTLDKVNLGIPAELTDRIIPVSRVQTAVTESENQEVFISLPALFQLKEIAAPHGVVLKANAGGSKPAAVVTTTLLTPRIDIELEIPEENIHRLPEALADMRYFSGAYFNGPHLILILNPEKLMESAK